MIRYRILFFAVFLLAATAVPAAQGGERNAIGGFDIDKVRELAGGAQTVSPRGGDIKPVQPPETGSRNYSFIVLRIIGSLALIIALIVAVSWLIRKFGLAPSSRIGRGGSMDVLEVLPLGQNRAIVLMRVMDTVYLCGQTASAIALLDKIEGPRAVELLTSGKGPSSVVQFKEAFNQFVARVKK